MKNHPRPFIIDVEASGFGPFSYPIEVGLALGQDERYCTLIAPAEDWVHWDENAQNVHNITRDTLLQNGKPIKAVAEELNEILGTTTVYSDGWVVDKPWINTLFNMARIQRRFFVSPLELILSEEQMQIWHETKKHILLETSSERHRASTDAFIIQQTYMKTWTMIN